MGAKSLIVAMVLWSVGSAALAAAPPTTLDDVVILARDSVVLKQNIRLANGQTVVNSPAGRARLLRSFAALADTQLIANSIVVQGGRHVIGPQLFDVFTNSPLAKGVVVNGDGPTRITLPLFAFPDPVSVTIGADLCSAPGIHCLVRTQDSPVTFLPGDYGDIIVNTGALLYFEGGIYNVRSIRGKGHSRFYFKGPTTLNVQQAARFGQRVYFGPLIESVLSGRCIKMNVGGRVVVKFAGNSNVTATVVAPSVVMKLGGSGEYRGQFVAPSIIVGGNALLEAPPALTSPCE